MQDKLKKRLTEEEVIKYHEHQKNCHVGQNKTSKHLADDNVCVQCASDSFEKTSHQLHRPHVAEDCCKYWSWDKWTYWLILDAQSCHKRDCTINFYDKIPVLAKYDAIITEK